VTVIHRRRKRARVHSISLRTFGWVCLREATFMLLAPYYSEVEWPWVRLLLARAPTAEVRRLAEMLNRAHEDFGM
jgi:hypothetical protein